MYIHNFRLIEHTHQINAYRNAQIHACICTDMF